MDLVNVTDYDNKTLLKCYIISLFIPDIPKPVLMLHGEQGSAKSTLQELIRMLVDPSSIKTVTFPRDITELVQKLMHNYICYFDNVSKIPEWISDQLCRAVTGSGFSKRELYTDDDDIIYNFKRCIGFNGINLGATKADLLDRGIIVELERIPKERMVKLEVIWQEFEKLKPQLLGYVFDILVKILQVKRNGGIEINSYPRMADFAEAGEIISRCMGCQDGAFLRVYYKNIDLQVGEAIEANPVGNVIVKFMEDKDEWSGTSTELLSLLEPIADSLKINMSKLWPKAPNSLSRRINEVKTNLRQIGIQIGRYITDQNIKGIEIRKISKISPDRQNDKNQAQVTSDTSGDITKYTSGISSEENNISPEKNPQNYAQSDVSGDTGDTGDIIRTSKQQPSSNNNTTKSTIYRLGQSDRWACYNCEISADKWFMQKHDCSGSRYKIRVLQWLP